jgi:hypothetical protein
MSETLDQAQAARRDRGEQLRALIVSWNEDKTFLLALNEQQRAIEEGSFELNEDWCIMADEILGAYLSQPKMDWPDEKQEAPQVEGPKIIIP